MVSNSTAKRKGRTEHTAARKLDEVELLTLLGPGDVGWDEGVHESLEVGTPPLRQCISNHPLIIDALSRKLCADWRKALVQPGLEALNLVVLGAEVVARAAVVINIHSIRLRKQ
jgi:hypothetical protein